MRHNTQISFFLLATLILCSLQSCGTLLATAIVAGEEAAYGVVRGAEKGKNDKLALVGTYDNEYEAVTTDSYDVAWDRAVTGLTKIGWISMSKLDRDNGIISITGLTLTKMTILESTFDGNNAYVVSAKVTKNMNVTGNFYIHIKPVSGGTKVNAGLINLNATEVTKLANILNYPVASTGVLEKQIGIMITQIE